MMLQVASAVSASVFLVAVAVPVAYLFFVNRSRMRDILPGVCLSILFSLVFSYALKFILGVDRPGGLPVNFAFTQLPDYSFPSSHAALAFAPLAFFRGRLSLLWLAYALVVSASRVLLGLHTLPDVFAGALLGYFIGLFFAGNSRFGFERDFLEVRRQAFHIALGLSIAYLAYRGIVTAPVLAVVLAAGLLLSQAASRVRIPLVSRIIELFERPRDIAVFPGRGAFFLVLGCMLSLVLFPRDVALASVMILSLGDSFSHLVGRFFGRTPQPFSVKLVEGTVAGMAAGFLGALLFIGVWEALFAAFFAMLAEAVELGFHRSFLDDNVLVPVVAGVSVLVFRLFLGVV
ncbi:phosphatase PAP2 family protein [Candidatus Woesearchaeota archaeon]|nr:phosphatase PAP2 family protein [Candidatus Woesearchaeota archaeon]